MLKVWHMLKVICMEVPICPLPKTIFQRLYHSKNSLAFFIFHKPKLLQCWMLWFSWLSRQNVWSHTANMEKCWSHTADMVGFADMSISHGCHGSHGRMLKPHYRYGRMLELHCIEKKKTQKTTQWWRTRRTKNLGGYKKLRWILRH